MKTYSIGRDLNCDIVINDSTDVISRRHALLNVTSGGKMTLIDQSSNGTYVNGIRISPNVPVPVTRKDNISLAHVAKLNWNLVPQSNQWIKYLIVGIIAAGIIIGVIFGIRSFKNDPIDNHNQPKITQPTDSTSVKQSENVPQDTVKNKEKQDTEKKKNDTIKNPNNIKKPNPKQPAQKVKDEEKKKEEKGKSDKNSKHPIG